jgi:5-methylthioadenosine/S-adenosylhomocysteine deaminase
MLKHESNFFKCVPCVHSIYTNSKETIIKTKEITRKNNQYFSIHAAETRKEVYDCYEKHKMYVIEYLDSLGVLDEKTILFHVGYITKDEVLILKKRGCIVVSNPISNMKLATGAQFPYVYLKNNGVNICLGTDGSASNNNLNMFEEMKVFSLLMKHNFWEADIAHPKEVLKIASKNAYDAFSINGGEIKKGNVSDFSLINVNNIDLIPLRKSNLISNLVFSFDGDVDYTFVNGNLSYKKEDLPKLSKRAKELGEIINSFMQKNA